MLLILFCVFEGVFVLRTLTVLSLKPPKTFAISSEI